jgi:hypothetical protein
MYICDTCAKYASWLKLPALTVSFTVTVHRIVERVLNDGISAEQKMCTRYVLNNISYQRRIYLLRLFP